MGMLMTLEERAAKIIADKQAKKDKSRDRDNERRRKFRADNAELCRGRDRQYRLNNPDMMERRKGWAKDWRTANPDYEWRRGLMRHYNLTDVEWHRMFESQGFKCASCGAVEHRGKNWHTDHCHETDRVRGILCHPCNTTCKGPPRECVSRLQSCLEYMKRHDCSE